MNNNNQVRNLGLGNIRPMQMPQPIPITQPNSHLFSQSPAVRGPHFPAHFQLTEPQAQRAHIQFQTHGAHTNATSASPVTTTPNSAPGGNRRVLQRPPSRTGGAPQATASPLKTMELTPAARRLKRKAPDKNLPDKVAVQFPESAIYTQMLELEARLDAAVYRKKVEIFDTIKNPPRFQKTLRVYVFNTWANQGESNNAEPPSWSLKIFGRLLGSGDSDSSYPKFSSFFKKITIYLDQTQYSENHVILWDSARTPAHHDGFEIKRKGNKEFTAIIRLEMNYLPEKFKLSPALQEVVGVEVETRGRVLSAIWYYIKVRKLQVPDDTSSFVCDATLRRVFGEERLKFSAVSPKLVPHLSAAQPFHLEHRIKLSGSSPSGNTCYDVLVDVPLTLPKEMHAFLASVEKNKEIDMCDETISASIKQIHEHQRRRAFFLGFSQSPAEFINALVASQARDLKVVSGDSGRDVEVERRSDFYNQPWTEDAVIRYLNRKNAPGTEHSASK